uniref:Uncharacterized protein n=1 Tax=Oryza rufipogon TaxID=4529 RepID=A0A0E0QMU2_ORYRU
MAAAHTDPQSTMVSSQ